MFILLFIFVSNAAEGSLAENDFLEKQIVTTMGESLHFLNASG